MCEKNATPIGMDFPVSSNPFFVTAMLRASCFVQKSYTCKKKCSLFWNVLNGFVDEATSDRKQLKHFTTSVSGKFDSTKKNAPIHFDSWALRFLLLLTQLDVEKGKARSFSVQAITKSHIDSDHTRCANSEW
jgi:hypothetical protein